MLVCYIVNPALFGRIHHATSEVLRITYKKKVLRIYCVDCDSTFEFIRMQDYARIEWKKITNLESANSCPLLFVPTNEGGNLYEPEEGLYRQKRVFIIIWRIFWGENIKMLKGKLEFIYLKMLVNVALWPLFAFRLKFPTLK